MRLLLSPVRSDARITASVDGDVLTVDGEVMDFGDVEEGDFLPREACSSPWIAGGVTRTDGEIVVPLAFPVRKRATDAALFPEPMDVESGAVEFPR